MRRVLVMLLAAVSGLAVGVRGHAQEQPPGVYVIFDASGSMWGKLADDSYKIHAARTVLQDFLARDFGGRELALRVYGHRREADCSDTELVVPFAQPQTAAGQVRTFLQEVNPLGRTPITRSLRAALADFGNRPGEIILISDGIETCNADPCALMSEWREKDVAVRVHVVGFGVEEQEKQALQCISETAGTEYRDAGSAQALAESLADIYERAVTAALLLDGFDAAGNRVPVEGSLTADGKQFDVKSELRNQVDAGQYDLVAGVRTRNGSLYRPITMRATVAQAGETEVRVEVPLPPRVYATFSDPAGAQRGSLVYAFQDGAEVFRFRRIDTVYVDPGSYEFRATPNAENELSVTATVQDGETKEIAFAMTRTVRVTFRMEASESGIHFRQNYELWQDGALAYKVHVWNGALVLPGTYDLRLPDRLTPYVVSGIEVTSEDDQEFTVTVPVGHVTFRYLKSDGSPDSDDRIWLSTAEGNQQVFRMTGVKYPLLPGRYSLTGWNRKGTYDVVAFEVEVGAEKEVELRAK